MSLSAILSPSGSKEDKLLESIDAGLDSFGKSVTHVIYWRFSTIYKADKRDVLKKPDMFRESLYSFFGERALLVESSVVSSIINTFHLSEVKKSDSLTRAISEAMKKIREFG